MPEYREKMRYENNKGEQGRTVMETVMKEQDKRAVESMCRCGLDLEGVIAVFPMFSKEDVAAVYQSVKRLDTDTKVGAGISINCSR